MGYLVDCVDWCYGLVLGNLFYLGVVCVVWEVYDLVLYLFGIGEVNWEEDLYFISLVWVWFDWLY